MTRLNIDHWTRISPRDASGPFTRSAYVRGDGTCQRNQLSRRHIQVLELFKEGLRSQDVAKRLHISVHTVNGYCSEIYRRLEVRNRPHAVIRAIELQFITLAPSAVGVEASATPRPPLKPSFNGDPNRRG